MPNQTAAFLQPQQEVLNMQPEATYMQPQQDGFYMQPPQDGFYMQPQPDGAYMQLHQDGLTVQEVPEAHEGFQLKSEVPEIPANGLEPTDPCLMYLRYVIRNFLCVNILRHCCKICIFTFFLCKILNFEHVDLI